MKRKSFLLLSALACFSLLATTGCQPEKVPDPDPIPNPDDDNKDPETPDGNEDDDKQELGDTYSLMKFWGGNPAEEIYTVNDSGATTTIEYTDATGEGSGGWEYVARSFAFDAAYKDQFTKFKKISFTGNLVTTAGSSEVMLKVEGADAANTYEARFTFDDESATYEMGLDFVQDWSQVNQLTFFVNRNSTESGSGTMTFSKFELSTADIIPEYDIAPQMHGVQPQKNNEYKGEKDKFTVMTSWGYDQTGVIETVNNSDGSFTFNYTKAAKGTEYAYVNARVTGELKDSGFKRMHFVFTGTKGQNVMFKFQTQDNTKAKEMTFVATGERQEVDVDISDVVAHVGADDVVPNAFMAGIFPLPGAIEGTGSITLHDCYMDTTEAVLPEDPHKDAVKPDGKYINVNKFYKADSCYEITYGENNVTTVNFDKGIGYESFRADIEGAGLGSYTKFTGTVVSTVDTHIMFKHYDAEEQHIALKANTPVTIDYTIKSGSIFNAEKDLIIFVAYQGEVKNEETGEITTPADNGKGTITLTNIRYEAVTDNVQAGNELAIKHFSTVPEQNYKVTYGENEFKVAYERTALDWNGIEATVGGENLKDLRRFTGSVVADVDTNIIIKHYGNYERRYSLKANQEVQILDVLQESHVVENGKFIIMIATPDSPTSALKGNVTFKNLKYVNTPTNASAENKIAIKDAKFVDETYKIAYAENKITVDYKKSELSYAGIQYDIFDDVNIKDYTSFKGTVTATADMRIIVKHYDGTEVRYELEANVPTTLDLDLTANDLYKKMADTKLGTLILMIAIPQENPDKVISPLEGHVEFTGLTYEKPAKAE